MPQLAYAGGEPDNRPLRFVPSPVVPNPMARSKTAAPATAAKPVAAYHHGNLREALLEAGLELLDKHGPEALGLRELARHVGVSRTAPYRHFESKEALIAAIAAQGFGMLIGYMEDARRREGHDIERWFLECGRQYLRFAFAHPAHYKVMFGDKFRYEPTAHAEVHAAGERAFTALVNLVAAAQQGGLVRAGNPVAVSIPVWAQLHGFVGLQVHDRLEFLGLDRKALEALVEQTVHDALAAVRAPVKVVATTRKRAK